MIMAQQQKKSNLGKFLGKKYMIGVMQSDGSTSS